MQSARTLRSHIFIWTCGWRGITLLPHCTDWFAHVIYAWASILAISYCLLLQVEPSRVGNVSSLMTDILFAFPALFFRAPKCGQLASRSRSVSTHIHTDLCTIYRCTARPPPPLPPLPLLPAAHWHFACFHCSMRLCCGRFRLYLFIIGRGIRRL